MALFDDLSTIFGAYATKINSLKSNLGNIANLDTSVKTSIVDAINAAQAEIDDAKAGLGAQDKYTILLNDEVPNTTQEYTFSNGKVSQVVHSRNSSSVRTDTFTYGTGTITEVRTLSTGENLTIVTNLTTLETTITYSED